MSIFQTAHLSSSIVKGVPVAVLTVEKISEYEAHAIELDLKTLGAAHRWRVAVDFQQVKLLASVGIGLLIQLNKLAAANKGKFVYFGMDANLLKLIQMTKLDRGMTIVKDREAAVKTLLGS